MADPKFGVRIFSVDEANLLLPLVRGELSRLRALRKVIVARQSQVDIEEMTGGGKAESSTRVEGLLREIERDVHAFHRATEELHAAGCELKDLDKGLVDFHGLLDGEIVYLCWMEGEDSVTHWHALDAGFNGRQKLDL